MPQEIRRFVAEVVRQNGGWRGILGILAVQGGTYTLAEVANNLSDQIKAGTAEVAQLHATRAALVADSERIRQRSADDVQRFVLDEIARGWCDAYVLDRAVEIEQTLRGDEEPIYGQRLRAAWRARQQGADPARYLVIGEHAPDGGNPPQAAADDPVDLVDADPVR